METKTKFITLLSLTFFLTLTSCQKKQTQQEPVRQQMVSQSVLNGVRLADGMPLSIKLSTRWEIADSKHFEKQFGSTGRFDTLVLTPKQLELANQVSNRFEHVDSVFTTQRQAFILQLKQHLLNKLGEEGVEVNDVIVSKIEFPASYTNVKERLALQEQELKSIRKQSVIDLENAEAQKKKAIAQGVVNVEQAQIDARLEKIQAEMEQSRRASMLAKAETDKQVAERRAQAEARRQVLLAEADARQRELYADVEVERSRKLNNVEVKKQEELAQVELKKEEQNNELAYQHNIKMASLCEQRPAYASYLINKQMAEKVQIAVLPNDKNATVFSGLLNQEMTFAK